MTQSRKICLLGASFETNNMGVGALAAGTINSILNTIQNPEIWFLDYGRGKINYKYLYDGKEIDVPLINMRFSKNIFLSNHIFNLIILAIICRIFSLRWFTRRIFGNNPLLQRLNEADLVFSISGGDSFSDIYGVKRFLYVSLPQILALLLRKRLFLLPQTLGPFNKYFPQMIAKYIFKNAVLVYSRDLLGLSKARDWIGQKDSERKLKFCYDMGFMVPPRRPFAFNLEGIMEKNRGNKIFIGLNVSGLLYVGGYNQRNMFGLKLDYRSIIRQIIEMVISRFDAVVILIPHVFGIKDELESDVKACENVHEEIKDHFPGKVLLLEGWYDQNEIKYIIGLCDFFIGSRMHACIAALSQGIPTIPIAYSNKFLGVFDSIGCAEMVVDPRLLNQKQILDAIGEKYIERDVIKNKISKIIPDIQKKIFTMLSEIDGGTR
jgi:colanic acid/amylovoran biosynthesis protein